MQNAVVDDYQQITYVLYKLC